MDFKDALYLEMKQQMARGSIAPRGVGLSGEARSRAMASRAQYDKEFTARAGKWASGQPRSRNPDGVSWRKFNKRDLMSRNPRARAHARRIARNWARTAEED